MRKYRIMLTSYNTRERGAENGQNSHGGGGGGGYGGNGGNGGYGSGGGGGGFLQTAAMEERKTPQETPENPPAAEVAVEPKMLPAVTAEPEHAS